MDWLTFIAHIVSALAWPVVIVALVLIFRDPLLKRLADLVRARVSRQGVELEFERQLAEIHERAEQAERQDLRSAAPFPFLRDFEVEIEDVLRLSPAAAMLEAFSRLESYLRRNLARLEDVEPPLGGGMRHLLRLASEHHLLGERSAALLKDLSAARNVLTHERHALAPTAGQAREYVQAVVYVALDVAARMGRMRVEPDTAL